MKVSRIGFHLNNIDLGLLKVNRFKGVVITAS